MPLNADARRALAAYLAVRPRAWASSASSDPFGSARSTGRRRGADVGHDWPDCRLVRSTTRATSGGQRDDRYRGGQPCHVEGCGFDANKAVYIHTVAPLVDARLTATADAKGCFADLADDAGGPGTYYLDAHQFRNGNSGNHVLAAETSFSVK